MTTILIINAISSLLASTGVVAFVAWRDRKAARTAIVQPLYLNTKTTLPPAR